MNFTMNCSVCEKKTVIPCPYCSYNACSSCIEHYLLESVHEPHCMSCRKEWSHEWIREHLSSSFIQLYRKRIEQLLFDKEVTLLPQTQPIVHLHQRLHQCNESISELQLQSKLIQDQIKQIHIQKDQVMKELCSQKKESYTFSCPYSSCRGYVNANHQCGLCLRNVCERCREPKEDYHQCKTETIQSLQTIQQDCKPCPRCSTFIYKTSGCDHMWCAHCHTHFHWNTLVIEKGILHNPHYYEYLASRGLSIGSDQINNIEFQQKISILFDDKDQQKILGWVDQLMKTRECIYPTIPTQNDTLHEDLRIKFLEHKINETELKAHLYKRHKRYSGYTSYRNVLDTFFKIMMDKISNPTVYFIEEYQDLIETMNQSILNLKKKYGFAFTLLP